MILTVITAVYTFYKELRSGLSTESFLFCRDLEYSKFLNSFLELEFDTSDNNPFLTGKLQTLHQDKKSSKTEH